MLLRCCVVIPAYEPGELLVPYVRELRAAEVGPVLVVDDGSSAGCGPIFEALSGLNEVEVLHHPANKGKGAALKTAIQWYLAHEGSTYEGCGGIVTADCDGQHTVEDVCAVAKAMEAFPERLVLGCRDFGGDTPKRSAAGNNATSWAMRALYNVDLKDTQTGLRGLSNGMLPGAGKIRGSRYEYELNMLLWAKQQGITFQVIPIQTIYIDNNSGSHYRTVRDSVRIALQLLRGLAQYGLSSLLSAFVDVAAYAVLVKLVLARLPLTTRMFWATIAARVVSSVVNYACNRKLPYMRNKKVSTTMVRYYILWFFQLAASFLASWFLCTQLHISELVAKYLVDILLAVVSYQIQLRWVFQSKDSEGT